MDDNDIDVKQNQIMKEVDYKHAKVVENTQIEESDAEPRILDRFQQEKSAIEREENPQGRLLLFSGDPDLQCITSPYSGNRLQPYIR